MAHTAEIVVAPIEVAALRSAAQATAGTPVKRIVLSILMSAMLSAMIVLASSQSRELAIAVRNECCPFAERVNQMFGTELALIFAIPEDEAEQAVESQKPKQRQRGEQSGQTQQWNSLFDGKSIAGWKSASFGGEGDVEVKDGAIVMNAGVLITGITLTDAKRVPRFDYEVQYEAMRADGDDFFAVLTFPFGDQCCTFVPGGWSGSVTGLSTIDNKDASENDTTTDHEYENNQWYKFRVRVTEHSIQCWVGNQRVVAQPVHEELIDIRPEVLPSKPFGFATFQSDGVVRNIRWRNLAKEEITKANRLREQLKAGQQQREKKKQD